MSINNIRRGWDINIDNIVSGFSFCRGDVKAARVESMQRAAMSRGLHVLTPAEDG